MTLLHLDSSILGDKSVSRTVSRMVVDHLKAQRKIQDSDIVYRDVVAQPISHLTGQYLAGQTADIKHDQALQADLKLGGSVLEEYLAAKTVVIGVGFYNFGIPSQLKAWVDRICVAGKTFRYSPAGAEGLAKDKTIIIAIARGGHYGPGTPHHAMEHAESYLRSVFTFLQVANVKTVAAEGMALGAEQREKSLQAAKKHIEKTF